MSNDQLCGHTIPLSGTGAPYATVILGVGNTLRGDDGLGPKVIDWLSEQDLPQDVALVDGGTSGLAIVSQMMGQRRAIIVDAADMHGAPGEWRRFSPDSVRFKTNDTTFSLHFAGLTEALTLAAALKVLPEEVIIYGVQPACIDWMSELSAEVQAVVPVVGQAVLQDVRRVAGQSTA